MSRKLSIGALIDDTDINVVVDLLIAFSFGISDGGDGKFENSLDLLPLLLRFVDDFGRNRLHVWTKLLDLVSVQLIVIPSPLDEFGVVEESGHFLYGHPLGESSLQSKFEAADQAHVRRNPTEVQVLEPLSEADDL